MIRFYGGDPSSTKALTPFLAKYFEDHLVEGMTREEVHRVIREYRQIEVLRKAGHQVTDEVILLDPLETLAVWVSYENGKFAPPVNIDRVLGTDKLIEVGLVIAGVLFLVVGAMPFERLRFKTSR